MARAADNPAGPTASQLRARVVAELAQGSETLLGPCYADHEPPRPAVELLRLHLPGREPQELAACAACAEVLRSIAL